jgi:hypothetical protein
MPTYLAPDELGEDALEAFDYIMNTPKAYELLSKAVVMLEAEAKAQHQSAPTELCRSINSYKAREWQRVCMNALIAARHDYLRSFASENRPNWYKDINLSVEALMACALVYRDRFSSDRSPT